MQKMAPEQWKQVFALLDTALDLPAQEREAWLASLDAGQSSLLPALREMLARHAALETDDVLRALPQFTHVEDHDIPVPGELYADSAVGAYRLIRELGRSGMGAVWLAERVDGKVRRQVALKFPYAGPEQRQLAERLLRERDILASLEHPNIARLYDADVTATGQPFLVLEYIDGVPIDRYCDEQRLPVRQRLVQFLQVLNAVQYAHAHLVIHRDIKPSNIHITSDGRAHLLDFGIARLLESGAAADSALTELGGRALTPDYASPEQIGGKPLSTSSDIYSLGVVLYELLAGVRPYRVKRANRAELEQAVADAQVIAPSRAEFTEAIAAARASSPRQLARSLRGDLDTIVLKALKKSPAERYASVDAFAQDLAHYLDGEAVIARPDSAWYRTRKFIGRHRLAAGASLAVVLALGAGLTIALAQLRVANAERQRAEDVKEFVASIFQAANPYLSANQSTTAVDLLALARERIDREMAGHPENAVELLVMVGESQMSFEQQEAAQATVEKAIRIGTASLPPDHFELLHAKQLLASVLSQKRDYDAANALFAEVIPALRKLGPRAAPVLADALEDYSFVVSDQLNEELGLASAREAVALNTATFGAQHVETILSKRTLAHTLLYWNRAKEAAPIAGDIYEASLAITGGKRTALLVDTEDLYGQILVQTDEVDKGIEHLRSAIANAELVYGPKNQAISADLGFLMLAQGRIGDLTSMLESAQRYVDAAPGDLGHARAQLGLGMSLLLIRRHPDALARIEEAIRAIEQFDQGKGSWLARARTQRGHALAWMGRLAEARQLLQENLAAAREGRKVDLALNLNAIGLAEHFDGHPALSEQAYREAADISVDGLQGMRWKAESLHGLGLAQLEQGHAQEAEVTLRQADTAVRAYFLKITPPRADVMVSLGRALLAQGRAAEALPMLAGAHNYWQEFDPANRCAGEAAYWYGRAQLALGEVPAARDSFGHASRILASSRIPFDARLASDARAQSLTPEH